MIPAATTLMVTMLPPALPDDEPGGYTPMMNDEQREDLECYTPYIDGNPRRIKRMMNVFNVSRNVAVS